MPDESPYAPPSSKLLPRPSTADLSPPATVQRAIRLLGLTIAMSLAIGLFGDLPGGDADRSERALVVVMIAINAAVIATIAAGRNWVRIAYSLLVLAGLPISVAGILELREWYAANPVALGNAIVQPCLQVAAVLLLMRADSRSWFRAKTVARNAA